jgi:hypothetical protein
MAKKFMYVCLGILALAIAFHLGARYGHATYVDHSTTGVIAYCHGQSLYPGLLLDNGEVYEYSPGSGSWTLHPELTPPVSLQDIKFWDGPLFVTAANELWVKEHTLAPWQNAGAPPAIVSTQPTSWGKLKAGFK